MNTNTRTLDQAATLSIENLDVILTNHKILNAISLELHKAEIGCLLGPSGCGKTTLLRSIAGFNAPATGCIRISGNTVSDENTVVAVEQRQVGMVFQDFALFPHLTVLDNITFGLKNQKKATRLSKTEQINRAKELLDLIDLSNKGNAYPHELSGGQQQRVALARALAPKPSIILLDEPFSSIDRGMRDELAYKIREILKKEQATTIMVTHDQAEAYAMADKIGVMKTGELLQWDAPLTIYHEPKNKFVADFIGESSFITSKLKGNQLICALGSITVNAKTTQTLTNGQTYELLVRPDDIVHDTNSPIRATVLHQFFKSVTFIYLLELETGEKIYAQLCNNENFAIGEKLGIRVEMEHVILF